MVENELSSMVPQEGLLCYPKMTLCNKLLCETRTIVAFHAELTQISPAVRLLSGNCLSSGLPGTDSLLAAALGNFIRGVTVYAFHQRFRDLEGRRRHSICCCVDAMDIVAMRIGLL